MHSSLFFFSWYQGDGPGGAQRLGRGGHVGQARPPNGHGRVERGGRRGGRGRAGDGRTAPRCGRFARRGGIREQAVQQAVASTRQAGRQTLHWAETGQHRGHAAHRVGQPQLKGAKCEGWGLGWQADDGYQGGLRQPETRTEQGIDQNLRQLSGKHGGRGSPAARRQGI